MLPGQVRRPFDALQTPKASTTGEAFHCVSSMSASREIAKRSVDAVADGYNLNHREKSPSRFAPMISAWDCSPLLTCAPLRLSGQADLPHKRSGSAGRSVCHQTKRHGALHIVTVFGPGGLVNRFSSLFSRKPLHLDPGVE